MLSPNSEAKLAHFFCQLSETELSVERSRQDLALLPSFDPYAAYNLLAVREINSVTLLEFLHRSQIHCSREEIQLLIRQYDSNRDGRLSLKDFYSLVLPSEDPVLRARTEGRALDLTLPPEAERALSRHIHLESDLQLRLESTKRLLNSMPGYSPLAGFRSINRGGTDYISGASLEFFLTNNGFRVTPNDIERIIRRVDIDGDHLISCPELAEALEVYPLGRSSPMKVFSRPVVPRSSPLQPSRKSSVPKTRKKSGSFAQSSPKKRTKSVRRKITRNVQGVGEIVNMLRTQIGLARELEEVKALLASSPDFTVKDLFRLLDLEDKGFLTYSDIENALWDLRVVCDLNDVHLLMKRYNTASDDRLREADFQEMWMPKEEYYKQLVGSRNPQSSVPLNRMSLFSGYTLDKVTRAFGLCIQCERVAEGLRSGLSAKTWIHLVDIFREIDRNDDGYITVGEFKLMLKRYGVNANACDLANLVDRYDKDLDGRVSYSEFIQEVTPKLY